MSFRLMKIISTWIIGLVLSGKILSGDYELDNFDVHHIYDHNNINLFIKAVDSFDLDIDELDENGFSVAHRAAKENKIEWLALLNWLHADLNKRDKNCTGWTPIEWAISSGNKNSVQLLLHYGVPLVRPTFNL